MNFRLPTKLILCAFFLTSGPVIHAAVDGAAAVGAATGDDFQRGVRLLQSKDAPGAVEAFKAALQLHPGSTAILTNLGIASFEAGQKGWSVAFLRQAVHLGSTFPETKRALNFSLSQLDTKELPHDIVFWEILREKILVDIQIEAFLLLLAIVLLLAGVSLIRFLAARKRAFANEEALPAFGVVPILASICLVFSLGLVWAKLVDLSQVRATVVLEKTPVVSSPSADAPSLLDLFAGLEVIVQGIENNFYQIQYPGGPIGWVAKDAVHVTQSSRWVEK